MRQAYDYWQNQPGNYHCEDALLPSKREKHVPLPFHLLALCALRLPVRVSFHRLKHFLFQSASRLRPQLSGRPLDLSIQGLASQSRSHACPFPPAFALLWFRVSSVTCASSCIKEYYDDLASRTLLRTTSQRVFGCRSSQYGASTTTRPRRRGSSIVSVLPVGLAIGKYIHKFHQCDLCSDRNRSS